MKAKHFFLRKNKKFYYLYLPDNFCWRIEVNKDKLEIGRNGRWEKHDFISYNKMIQLSWQPISKAEAKKLYPELSFE